MNQRWKSLPLVIGVLCNVVVPAQADLGVTEIPIVDAPAGTVGLGFGIREGTSPYIGVENTSSINNDNDTVFPQTSYTASLTFTSALAMTPIGLAWDGTNLWTCTGGNVTGQQLARYTATGASLNTYGSGLDFRSLFTKGDGTSPIYKSNTDAVVQVQGTFGSFSNHVTLGSPAPVTDGALVYDATRAHYVAFNAGIVRRWDDSGAVLTGVTLSGYGTQTGEAGTQGFRIATANGYYLTFVNTTQVLSAWDESGTRVATTTLTSASSPGPYSMSYAQGKVWVIDGTTWSGYDVGL